MHIEVFVVFSALRMICVLAANYIFYPMQLFPAPAPLELAKNLKMTHRTPSTTVLPFYVSKNAIWLIGQNS